MTIAETALSNTPICPSREMGAYEALWSHKPTTFKSIAESVKARPGALPSELVDKEQIGAAYAKAIQTLREADVRDFGVQVHGSVDYPQRLRHAEYPVEFLYYRGSWDLIDAPKRIAIVGAREASPEGIRRTRKLTAQLVSEGFTIVSGLAKGIDTAAHQTALEYSGRTIAVIGTPIHIAYPSENKELQEHIARYFLVVSQIPIVRYGAQDYRLNRHFFPERNATMSALADATVIVEASDTSGTLAQARAALYQGRKLFILANCFRNPEWSWPQRLQAQGATRVDSIEDIKAAFE